MIERTGHLRRLKNALRDFPVVAILGARQVGKTTLARQLVAKRRDKGRITFFDLERAADLAELDDPSLALEPLRGLVVIDEVQRKPELFATLRVLADRPRKLARFLVLGSASPEMLRQSSESLAGRIAYHTLTGFSLEEVGVENMNRLWLRGGFPRSYLARSLRASVEWRESFVRTFLERDLPQLGVTVPSVTLGRFWSMLAHYHGQVLNASELGRSFGVGDTTIRRYLDLLTHTLVCHQLLPWHENIRKRQVRAPKVYLSDSGLLHTLLGIETMRDLQGHPKVGASWEGFLMAEVIRHLEARERECYFWATHQGAELDLFVTRGTRRRGFEFKRTTAPRLTRSMRSALADLRLESLEVVHAGKRKFPMAPRVQALPANQIATLKPLR